MRLHGGARAAGVALVLGAALPAPATGQSKEEAREAYERGLAKRNQRDCRGALAQFDRALELRPSYFNALYQRGNCRQAVGHYEQAIADYTRAIGLPGRIPPRFLAYYARGDAHRRLGRLELALKDYSAAASLR